jgi:hypothetical protein
VNVRFSRRQFIGTGTRVAAGAAIAPECIEAGTEKPARERPGAGNAIHKANDVKLFDFHDIGNAVSAPLASSSSGFAQLGTERNGSFYPHS